MYKNIHILQHDTVIMLHQSPSLSYMQKEKITLFTLDFTHTCNATV